MAGHSHPWTPSQQAAIRRHVAAYFVGVFVGIISPPFVMVAYEDMRYALFGGTQIATSPLAPYVGEVLEAFFGIVPLSYLAFFLPWLIVLAIYLGTGFRRWWFFPLCGTIAGATFGVFTLVILFRDWRSPPLQTELETGFLAYGLPLACCGMLGGLIYWYIAERPAWK